MPKNNLLLAVSGGVDSMLLAHILQANGLPFSLAHFNHGLRPDSDQDEQLVRAFAAAHHIPLISETAQLPDRSEATAREARHAFLARAAAESGASAIATGHHLDDLVETIAINLTRGTGWRGLAVLNRPGYLRPLLELEKNEIRTLAQEFGVRWREDSTNRSAVYLRNRLRPHTETLPFDTKWQLLKLRQRQVTIAHEITALLGSLSTDQLAQKSLYQELEPELASELLHEALGRQGVRTTRPERAELLVALKSYQPGKLFQLTAGRFVRIERDRYSLR